MLFRSLASQIGSYNITTNIGWPYETKGITLNAWYGIPVTLESNVLKLHKEVFEQEDYEISEIIKSINDKIISKTGYNN